MSVSFLVLPNALLNGIRNGKVATIPAAPANFRKSRRVIFLSGDLGSVELVDISQTISMILIKFSLDFNNISLLGQFYESKLV